MDRELMIKDLAALIGTTEDTIINWELRDVKPTLKRHRKGLVEFLGPEVYDGRIPTEWPLLTKRRMPHPLGCGNSLPFPPRTSVEYASAAQF